MKRGERSEKICRGWGGYFFPLFWRENEIFLIRFAKLITMKTKKKKNNVNEIQKGGKNFFAFWREVSKGGGRQYFQ